ncbi:MAG: NPCBM/NEW2 domain-containing protein [Janthinobacterium lividum]
MPKTEFPKTDFARQWLLAALEAPVKRVHIDSVRQGWGHLQMGQSVNGTPFCLGGRAFDRGLGVHADSEVRVTLDAPARRLKAWVGVDDNKNSRLPITQGLTPNSVLFSVEIEGRVLWQSPPLTVTDTPVEVDIPLPDVSEFTLKAEAADGQINNTAADWADVSVELADGSYVDAGESLAVHRLPQSPIFSFLYNGQSSSELLREWAHESVTETLAESVLLHRVTYRDPETEMAVILEIKEFEAFPAVEWVVRFRNEGSADTPLLENIQSLDILWTATEDTWLHRSQGSQSSLDDFAYHQDKLESGCTVSMDAGGGRSSTNWLPFFSLQTAGTGVVAAIGWSGQWAAQVSRDTADAITIRAGMERTHLVLHPGEEIRTPSTALIFWEGKPINGSNLLRRFLIERHTPRPDGKLLPAPLTTNAWGGVKTAVHVENIRRVKEQKLPYDTYWIDAGWYGTPEGYSPIEFTGKWWNQVGNWFPNPISHPDGMKPIGEAAREAGLNFLLWFEPERAIWGTQITQEHPDWFLGEQIAGRNCLLDLRNTEAKQWMTEYISGCIDEWNLGFYRQDFNMEPLIYWQKADAPDRQGMTEISHIQALYAFWDELLRRHPGLVIDNCASGGRRLDLETTGRSIPLWRSDYQCTPGADPMAAQCHTFGLSYWLPLSGTAAHIQDGSTYDFRSALSAALIFNSELPEWRSKMMADYHRARPLWYGDFYPLTRYSANRDVWCAYQLHRTDLGEGMVLAFRREECPFTQAEFALEGLEPDSQYMLEDADTGETRTMAGRSIAENGLRISMGETRESRLIFYRRS